MDARIVTGKGAFALEELSQATGKSVYAEYTRVLESDLTEDCDWCDHDIIEVNGQIAEVCAFCTNETDDAREWSVYLVRNLGQVAEETEDGRLCQGCRECGHFVGENVDCRAAECDDELISWIPAR